MVPSSSMHDIPSVTTEQMAEVDRSMVEDFKIELLQMMENAGRNLAHLARRRFLEGDPRGKLVTILAGTGGNGGGALVCARRLCGYGAQVTVLTAKSEDQFAGVPGHQLEILRRMGVPILSPLRASNAPEAALIVDGLIGYGLKGAPREAAGDLIRWANTRGAPTLALDAPSGLDTATGKLYEPSIRAAATMTLALPKAGLLAPGAESAVGELYLADIGVPPSLFAGPGLGLEVGPIFAKDDIIRLR